MPNARNLQTALRALRAPANVSQKIMLETGLADRYALRTSPLGEVYVAFNARGVSSVSRARSPRAFERQFAEHFHRPAIATDAVPAKLLKQFDLHGLSEFQRSVLLKALEIPRGEVRPYSWVAAQIGRPKAVRAVGTALARNPVPLLIPCHRVVRSDGTLGEYALGSRNKRRILESEGVKISSVPRGLARAAL